MASLGHYFGLGKEKHRALEDSKMTIDVLKGCCTLLFLEEKFPALFPQLGMYSSYV